MKRIQTHCFQGHPLLGDSVYRRSGDGARTCVKCLQQRLALRKRGYPGALPLLTCDKGHPWSSPNIILVGTRKPRKCCQICRNQNQDRYENNKKAHNLVKRIQARRRRRNQLLSKRKAIISRLLSGKDRHIHEYKANNPCVRCGEKDTRCLDMHHREPGSKLFNIFEHGGYSLEMLKIEILKCEVLCSNCHRKHHTPKDYRLFPSE